MGIVPWEVQLRAELALKKWTTICIQCNTLGSSFIDTVYTFLSSTFPETVVTIMHPTECCLNIDCALHHKDPVIIAIDIHCPLAYNHKTLPVVHVSSKGMVMINSLYASHIENSGHTIRFLRQLASVDPLFENKCSNELDLPPNTTLLFEKHYLMKARATGLPRDRRLCVNGDNWLFPLLEGSHQRTPEHIAIYIGPSQSDYLSYASALNSSFLSTDPDSLVSRFDFSRGGGNQDPEVVNTFISNVHSFALPGYLCLLLSLLATRSETSIQTFILIDILSSTVHSIDIARLRAVTFETLAKDRSLLKSRLTYCVSPLKLDNIGIIIGDAHQETVISAIRLKALLQKKNILAHVCYFGPKLDEAKLGNFSRQFSAFVFMAKCPSLMLPWINSNFRRVASHYVPCISLYELRYSIGETKSFCYEYDSILHTCMGRIYEICDN